MTLSAKAGPNRSAGHSAPETTEIPLGLPGAELVTSGIEALKRGDLTVEALLVCVGATRMRLAGLEIPPSPPLAQPPEIELYLAIGAEHPDDTHSRYNALIRRLVSFERALERLGLEDRYPPNCPRSHSTTNAP